MNDKRVIRDKEVESMDEVERHVGEDKGDKRREMVERNRDKERRKMEWKKVKIMAKEKLNEERMMFIREEEEAIRRSMSELAI